MKSIKSYIQEKLIINKNSSYNNKKYNYHPKTKDELKELVERLIKERGDNADLNDIDVSKITDMSELFYGSKFNGDISKWNVGNVENMRRLFSESEFNGDISDWDISKVANMRYLFYKSKFNRDISEWDISNVIDMSDMFIDCPIKDKYMPKIYI